jgi:hypothetical protein
MERMVAVSRSGRYAVVREGDVLWVDDQVRGPHATALPCDGDFAFAQVTGNEELWVSHGGTLSRFALPSLQRREQLDIAATRFVGDGEQVLVRTAEGWLAQRGGSLEPISSEPDECVFPIGQGRRVHALDGSARVVDGDAVHTVDLGGPLLYAAPGLGRGWLALVDRGPARRELAVVAGDHRVVRRIGVANGAAMRSGAAGGRALVVTARGHLMVVDLRTGEMRTLDELDGDRLDAACDATGRRVVAATRTHNTVAIHQSVLAAA